MDTEDDINSYEYKSCHNTAIMDAISCRHLLVNSANILSPYDICSVYQSRRPLQQRFTKFHNHISIQHVVACGYREQANGEGRKLNLKRLAGTARETVKIGF